MNEKIAIRINRDLIRMLRALADGVAKSIGADPPEFYLEHYLNFTAYLESIFSVGEALGIKPGHSVLEIGSGLGTRCLIGSAIWNANFTGLEPCSETYSSLKDAILEFKRINADIPYISVDARGEATGLASDSYDFVISCEVLEHVENSGKVIAEMHRVLKPGGKIFFSTCNYNSFYEGHYHTLWFPFLNKKTGRIWVKWLGYNPKFVDEINFITRSSLLRNMKDSGFKKINLGYLYPAISPPRLEVDLPEGFDPLFKKERGSFLGRAIQHPISQKALGLIGMEYKICGIAEK